MVKYLRLTYLLITIVFVLIISTNSIKAQNWELLWSYDVSALAGINQYGVDTDGSFIYTSFLNENGFAKFDLNGNWLETFSIPDVILTRDLAYDGTYFYGSTGVTGEPISIFDFTSQSIVGTIPMPLEIGIKNLAYDIDNDGFWIGDYNSDLTLIGRNGATINTIPQTAYNVESIAGSAFDNISPGGPYLWLHSQWFSECESAIVQIDIATGTQTGIWHNAMSDAGLDLEFGNAGGLFNSTYIFPGSFVIGGLIQGSSYNIFAYSMQTYGNPPPLLISPENESYGNDIMTIFQWEAIENAVSYQIQVSLLSDFSINEIDIEDIDTTMYQANFLEQISKYYWRVRVYDTEGNYGVWSRTFVFFTEGDLPEPELITPENNYIGLLPNTQFSWTGHIAASNYHLQISSSEDFEYLVIDEPALTMNSFISTGLEMNTQYWWRVAMENPVNTSFWSYPFTFTTGSIIQIGTGTGYNEEWDYPTAYGNASGGAKQQLLIRPEEIFEAGGSQGFLLSIGFNVAAINSNVSLLDYEIKLKSVDITELNGMWDLEEFTSVYYNIAYLPYEGWNTHTFVQPYFWDGVSSILVDICFNNMENTTNESCYLTTYPYIATQYYQNSYDETICSEYPQWTTTTYNRLNMQFELDIPPILPPFLEIPANKTQCVSTLPIIDWTDCEEVTSYLLQISTDIDFNFLVFEIMTTESNYQLTEENILEEVTQYYWRVNAIEGNNISYWSKIFSFVTEGDLIAPFLISPEYGELGLEQVQFFNWERVVGASIYRLQIATDFEFISITHDVTTTDTQIRITNLPLNSEIFWRVKGENECSEGIFADAWTFTTNNIPFAYGYNWWWVDVFGPGPVMFSLSNPQNIIQIQNQQDEDYLSSGTWANGLWYAFSTVNYNLYSLDPATGDRTIIGSVGYYVLGISYDVQTETMYAICYIDGNYILCTIDLVTASPTQIGSIGNRVFSNLAASIEGELFSICVTDNCFYSIDKYTGQAILIGPLGYNVNYDNQDLEFEKLSNTCYWAGYCNDNGRLLTIDIETGAATEIGTFPVGVELYALAIPFIPACLDFPELSEPSNKSVCIDANPQFNWSDVQGALTYSLEIAYDRSLTNIVLSAVELTTSSFTLPEGNSLNELIRYYWRIRAYGEDNCNSYWSSIWSFVVEGDLPQTNLVNPPNGVDNFSTTVNFIWEENIGTEHYYLQVSTNTDFSDLIIDQSEITETDYIVPDLELSTQYFWRVKMISSCSESDWSEVWTFTTGGFINIGTGTDYNDPYTYPAPYGNSYDGCKHQILIRAEELVEAGAIPGMITSLVFDVAEVNAGTTLQDFYISIKYTDATEIDNVWDLGGWTLVFGPEDYTPVEGWNSHQFFEGFFWDGISNILLDICFNNNDNTSNESMYYTTTDFNSVRRSSRNNYAEICTNPIRTYLSANRPNISFNIETSAILSPIILTPEDSSYCVSTTPVLDWEDSEGASSYNLVIAIDISFEFIVLEISDIFTSEFQIPAESALEENTQYYWRVNASDGNAISFWSNRFGFITEGDLPTPSLYEPQNEYTDCATSIIFSWAGFLAATNYHIQVATDVQFNNIVTEHTDLTSTELMISGLEMITQHWWRVRMISPCVEGDWSEIRTFTTGAFIQIGTENNFNGQWEEPAPYSHSSSGSKNQYLIRASELIETGMMPGIITSLSFDVVQINSGATLNNFTISLKHTSENELTESWDLEDWTLVYGPIDYTPTLGWNIHLFDFTNVFSWDGASNILVDVCFNNYPDVSNTFNESTSFSFTDFVSTRFFGSWGYPDVCSSPSWGNVINQRPNMLFGVDISRITPPILISPENYSFDVPITPLFEWNASDGANYYELQVATDRSFSNIVINQSGIESTSYQVPVDLALIQSTLYFWRVNGSDLEEYTSYWSRIWPFTTVSGSETQNISLASGWNIISSYIEPENAGIENIFEYIATDVKIVKNGIGQIYDPAFSINNIGNWNYKHGYLVNMLNEDVLAITGLKLLPEETPINLNNGWNLSAYLRDNQMSPTTALASITSSLVLAKDNAGGIFSPVYGINTLGNMQSGQGYYFYMNAAAELTYPANSTQKAVAGDEITPLAKYNIPTIGNTGKNATLLISIENNDGNEIGVYNMNNELIGAGAVHNGVAAITIWGDDEATQNVDGAKDNEYLNVKLYNTNNNTSKEISLSQIKEITSDTEQSELYYKTNAIYVAKASAHNESGFAMSIKNIPNPVENDVVFEFGLTQEANAEIQIYTSTGELVAKIGNGNYTAGLHRINFDASNLANGMYNIVLSSGSKKVSSFMVVDK